MRAILRTAISRGPLLTAAIPLILGMAAAANAGVTISTAQTQNVACANGVCAPTAKKAVLNVSDLENLLASGDVEVTTTGSNVQANNIDVAAALSWSTASTLVLDASNSVAVDKAIAVAGQGGLAFTTAVSTFACTLTFGREGSASFANLASPLTINGASYTLVGNLKSLAQAIKGNPSGAYALANDYDASKDGVYSNSPIVTQFAGAVEGLGNTISNLSIASKLKSGSFGLFTYVGATGIVDDLRVSKINYTSASHAVVVGGLTAANLGFLCGDHVSGSIRSADSSGGLVFTNAWADEGYLVGKILSSSTSVRISSHADGGGLVVSNEGRIQFSHASGNVTARRFGGGFAVHNGGVIAESYATGAVSGRKLAAGLLVANLQAPNEGELLDSYATGDVKGAVSSGLIGSQLVGFTTTSYSTGAVPSGNGGFVCTSSNSRFSYDYWDVTTSGAANGACGGENFTDVTGLTTKQLQSGLPSGFERKVWAVNAKINHGLPYLIHNKPE